MVKVREDHPRQPDGSIDLTRWLERLSLPEQVSAEALLAACQQAQQADQRAADVDSLWSETVSSLATGLEMVEILTDLHLDEEALIAAVLYRAVREDKLAIEEVRQQFGGDIARLIEGVLRVAALSRVRFGFRETELCRLEGHSATMS